MHRGHNSQTAAWLGVSRGARCTTRCATTDSTEKPRRCEPKPASWGRARLISTVMTRDRPAWAACDMRSACLHSPTDRLRAVPARSGAAQPAKARRVSALVPMSCLFQVVHQAAELWMKLVDHEMQQFWARCSEGRPVGGVIPRRCAASCSLTVLALLAAVVWRRCTRSLHTDYMRIREVLGRGSGQESPGFKRLLCRFPPRSIRTSSAAGPSDRGPRCIEMLSQAHPVTRRAVCRSPKGCWMFDLRLQEWRNRHILLVYRTIGLGTPSLKGKHSELLGARSADSSSSRSCGPVRDELYGEWSRPANPSGSELCADRDRSRRSRAPHPIGPLPAPRVAPSRSESGPQAQKVAHRLAVVLSHSTHRSRGPYESMTESRSPCPAG
jgi:hypothetical protein